MGEATKNVLLRLEPQLAEQLAAVAEVEGRTVSDVVRGAIADLVNRRKGDAEFQAALKAHMARNNKLLEALSQDER